LAANLKRTVGPISVEDWGPVVPLKSFLPDDSLSSNHYSSSIGLSLNILHRLLGTKRYQSLC